MTKNIIITILLGFVFLSLEAQKLIPFKLPDTGQNTGYSATKGEDADIIINPLSYTDNGDGTITDNNTGLMWQKTDGGEMTYENAIIYCNNSTLAGYSDWRLPAGIELFSINSFNRINPALDTVYFTKTLAEYWWTSEVRADDNTKVWVVNGGGGIGAHPKTETISAGGIKKIHVRAVRNPFTTTFSVSHFADNGNGTITDNYTGLIWQKTPSINTMTWEKALIYSDTSTLSGKTDWRLPNVKELQSLNDVSLTNPSFSNTVFPGIVSGNYWSSTTLLNPTSKAWDINIAYGIVSQNDKILSEHVILVRGGFDYKDMMISEALIPGDEYEMGDHFGFVDPGHPSDETPVHTVKVDSFYISKTETSNQQFLAFLNSSLSAGLIHVNNNRVYLTGDTNTLYLTNQYSSYYSIGYNGSVFSIADFRTNHPVVGVMWSGAAAYCNWLSLQNGLESCYNLSTWICDFTKKGFRLPTEAEWEFAGRGGHTNPYFIYANGDTVKISQTNLPNSGDPYETASNPQTTPVGFYDGALKQKSDYNWPGNATTYQTKDGANGFGLYDMQGNVWEFINDWYGQNYYDTSPYGNPTGPTSGFIMPDGKPYRGMRGGNWYNGLTTSGVNDGHSRVANRNPSYYRGPQDPNHPYYHIGFRFARKYSDISLSINDNKETDNENIKLYQNYPNPFKTNTNIRFELKQSGDVSVSIYNIFGQLIKTLVNENLGAGIYKYEWNSENMPSGIYTFKIQVNNQIISKKMSLIK